MSRQDLNNDFGKTEKYQSSNSFKYTGKINK